MKRKLTAAFLCLAIPLLVSADTIGDMLARILPTNGDATKFEYSITGEATQQFTIDCDGSRVSVSGSDAIAVATGINWYLQHYAGIDISWNSPTGVLPATLPVCSSETHTSSVDWRYYLNFCTYSYSMAFWDWERWQRELDWMALHGVNMPLAITGMECVWKHVLMETYGYTLDEVNTFVSGSGYYGWFFMNNLTAWGGPQPVSWYAQQHALARNIFRRMKDFGMSPVIPGYVGMIPKDFLSQADAATITGWAASDIVNGGNWCSFVRPYFVNNTQRLKEFAADYYAAFEALYGDVCATHFYAIDPFHEGGVPSGVTNASASVTAMWDALQAYDADAVWVAQHWQDNPTTTLTHAIPRGRLVILDLHGDQYADTQCSGQHTTSGGENHDWVWGQVSNFGGNVGLFGRLDRLISCFYAARNGKAANKLVGIGAIPEGIENNAMLYDLLYALPWTTTDYTRQTWTADYVHMRYGLTPSDDAYATVLSAWTRLAAGIYQCPNNAQQGTTESVFLMRPSLTAGTVSSWANSTWYWNIADVRTALYEMLSVSDALAGNENYRYDLIDLARQALADYGKELLGQVQAATGAQRLALADRFLTLILDQDRLLGTRRELRLGRWTEAARALGTTAAEKALYEQNARMLLTTWGDRAQCENGGLHDYANREWQGLLSSYYYPRWKAFFDNGYTSQSWFQDYEWPFATGTTGAVGAYLPADAPYAYGTFSATPVGDEIAVAQELYAKYFQDFKPEVWERCVPDLITTYTITNAEAWYGAADTEGLCLAVPNSDYNGYRLQRAALDADNTQYQWRFVASTTTPGAVRLQSVALSDAGHATPYLDATPSSAAYAAFTFSSTGSDFYLYRCGDRYYLQQAGQDVFMQPDTKWATTCVLVGNARSATSLLHLMPYWAPFVPDPQSTFNLTNVNGWYQSSAADSEGLCLSAPNNDYNGYRLRRAVLAGDDASFQWRFVASDVPGAVKLQNVYLKDHEGDASVGGKTLLSSTPSSSGYKAFTFSSTGTDFYLFRHADTYYLQEVGQSVFMAPDCGWPDACVLVGASRTPTSLLHLVSLGCYDEALSYLAQFATTNAVADNAYFGVRPSDAEALRQQLAATYADHSTLTDEVYASTVKPQIEALVRIPSTGCYRIINAAYGRYISYGTPNEWQKTDGLVSVADAAADAAAVIRLTGADGIYTLSTQGLNVQSQRTANQAFPATTAEGVPFAFTQTSPGTVSITSAASAYDANHDGSLHDANWSLPSGVVNWSAAADASKWHVEDATSLDIVLNNGGDGRYYSTLCLPFDVTLSGATAYTLTLNATRDRLRLSAPLTQIPASTPVLVIGERAIAEALINQDSPFAPIDGGHLTGTFLKRQVSGATDYFLGVSDGAVGFYHWDGTVLSPNRAYLPASAIGNAAAVKGFAIELTPHDAVTATPASATPADIFTLSGMRLARRPATRGIYLVNGKQVLIK
ncbi:MAG: alpha-N-acetylglucosaminidase [Bacteroidaceae bacterium]|nr:alpha-N-acetylglucosaminidase [Bacteroidaceae bacterium]